jgi:GMP synthase-like glutamine amidotransferase
MKTLVIDNNISHMEELLDFLPGEKIVVSKDEIKDIKTEEYNLLVLPGSMEEVSVLQNPELFQEEIALVKKFEGAILGMCLGTEILTVAFDGELIEQEGYIREDTEITFLDNETMVPSRMVIQEGHHIGILSIPSEFEICGYSEQYPEIIKHEEKPIIGLQFHPEIMYDDAFNSWLFKNLLIRNG